MSLVYQERDSESSYIETITWGHTLSDGSTIRPAEIHSHMVFVKHEGQVYPIFVGPLTSSGIASWGADAEILWIKLKLGSFMPHLPLKQVLDRETALPGASSKTFWLKGSAWQFPDFENVDSFIGRLVREEVLVKDPIVKAALQDQAPQMAERTLRHRFLRATGLSQNHIRQYERAQQAAALLQQGLSILDTVYEAGYFDQPHLTRSLKRFVGKTPAQLLPDCHSVQDGSPAMDYHANVLIG